MNLICKLKAAYQKPFRNELQSISALILYKAITKILAIGYTIRYWRQLLHSHRSLARIRSEIIRSRKSAFVFANGPSLSDIDLIKIKQLIDSGGYDLIAINSFLSKSLDRVLPTFAVFSDNLHFEPDAVNSQYSQDVAACKRELIRSFVPIQHLNTDDPLQIGFSSFCDIYSNNTSDLLRPPGYYGLTAFHALRVAKHLGYLNIYICGFDNSYFKDFEVTREGLLVVPHRHYYDQDSNLEASTMYGSTSEFFFDSYRHFEYLEKICKGGSFHNIAKTTYINCAPRTLGLDVYN
jgi:hypothetical protein